MLMDTNLRLKRSVLMLQIIIPLLSPTVNSNEPVVDLSLQSGAGAAGSSSVVASLVDQGGNTGGSATKTVTKTTRTIRTNQISPVLDTTSQDFSFFVDNTAPDGEFLFFSFVFFRYFLFRESD